MPDPTDAAIVAGLRAGDRVLSAALYRKYRGHVRACLAARLGAADRVLDDLTQDVFVAAIAGRGRLSDPSTLSRWLEGLCDSAARRELRRRAARPSVEIVAPHELPDVGVPALDPVLHDAARVVLELIDKLRVDDRVPFCMRIFEDKELPEIAATCEVSLATAKRRIKSARETFAAMATAYPELADWIERHASESDAASQADTRGPVQGLGTDGARGA